MSAGDRRKMRVRRPALPKFERELNAKTPSAQRGEKQGEEVRDWLDCDANI
jgi:hypothetical protein